MDELTEVEGEMLELERSRFKYQGAKESLIRERWDISETVYYQRLAALIEKPAAEARDPMTVRRLRRLRDQRRAARRPVHHVHTSTFGNS